MSIPIYFGLVELNSVIWSRLTHSEYYSGASNQYYQYLLEVLESDRKHIEKNKKEIWTPLGLHHHVYRDLSENTHLTFIIDKMGLIGGYCSQRYFYKHVFFTFPKLYCCRIIFLKSILKYFDLE